MPAPHPWQTPYPGQKSGFEESIADIYIYNVVKNCDLNSDIRQHHHHPWLNIVLMTCLEEVVFSLSSSCRLDRRGELQLIYALICLLNLLMFVIVKFHLKYFL